jgi:multicomponent Na+:H+ antiporter subunit G
MTELLAFLGSFLIVAGGAFGLIAAIGIVRFPDLYCRLHASTKAGAFGAALVLFGAAILKASGGMVVRAVLLVVFFYITAPLASHLLARAARTRGERESRDTANHAKAFDAKQEGEEES